jgi:uncharacterized glyoxalase superfamily protein PhnB
MKPAATSTPSALELKAFVPATDFERSKQFYDALGFKQKSEGGGIAFFSSGACNFLLQDLSGQSQAADYARQFVMHLQVSNANDWWAHVMAADLVGRFDTPVTPIIEQPWGMTEFVLIDPSGVCWHNAQNTPGFEPVGR